MWAYLLACSLAYRLEMALRHYNEERLHSSLDYLTPIEYEKKKQEEAQA